MGLLGPLEILRDFLDGLSPGDPLPSPLSSGPFFLQGVGEATGVGEAISRSQPFGTQIALIQETLGIAFNLNDPVIFNPYEKGATAVIHSGAMGSHPPYLFRHGSLLVRLGFASLLHTTEEQRL
jgi:hypothetical protein